MSSKDMTGFKDWLITEVQKFFFNVSREDLGRVATEVISGVHEPYLFEWAMHISSQLDQYMNLYITSMVMQSEILKHQAQHILTCLKEYLDENITKNAPRSIQLIIETHKRHFESFFYDFKENPSAHEYSQYFLKRLKDRVGGSF